MLFFYCLVAMIAYSDSLVILDGPCHSSISVEGNMAWEKFFNGTWYEIRRYPILDNNLHCVELSATMKNKTEYMLMLHGMKNGEMVHDEKVIILPFTNIGNMGIFTLGNRFLKVVLTETESFAVLHECVYNVTSNTKTIHNWILSRDLYLKKEAVELITSIFSAINSTELQLDLYGDVKHDDDTCKASSISGVFLSLMLACIVFINYANPENRFV
ncbi:uncharacterized protein LOC143921077 [Arctopsyche grandis]|uniref:uncharacterized protein LOC143921077 n=1 Tax=Arctopsyche grandis TaxID=121162 RepID=UPI00406D6D70